MTETLFEFDERNYLDCQKAYRGPGNQEYYLGDYSIEDSPVIDVRAERESVGPCSIIRLRSSTRLFFRRSWAHIRQDATDVTVLWFVDRGRLCISHQGGHCVAEAGDFLITKSMTSFYIECQTDKDSVHEVLHVIVPTHLLRRFIPDEVTTGFTMAADSREFVLGEQIISHVFESAGSYGEDVGRHLMESAFSVLANAIRKCGSASNVRQSVSDRRLNDVLRYIENHLSDPGLSISSVAEGCGISPRYTSYLLKLHGTPFSTFVWEQRLKMAAQWIQTAEQTGVSISEIAYRVGFKSPAHFSRMFKRVYKLSPSEYRTAHLLKEVQNHDYLISGNGKSLQ